MLSPAQTSNFSLTGRFLVKFIFLCTRQTMFLINISVTSFINSLHVADTSKYFMYIYYIGLKTNQTLIYVLHFQIKAFPSQFFMVGRTHEQFSWFKSWHDQLLNKAPCQGKLVNFLPYIRAIKTCQNKFVKEKLPVVCAGLYTL